MSEDLISDIRKRHEHDAMMTDFLRVPKLHWAQTPAGWWAHRDRAMLLAEVERLQGLLADLSRDMAEEIERLRTGLHRVSLASQNSMSSKEECGRIARETLGAKP